MNVTLWNVEWAKPATARGRFVQSLLEHGAPDVICVTEGYPEIFPSSGHSISSSADYGYAVTDGRRKVMLWSRQPWEEVEAVGDEGLPPGRFVSGVTGTPLGPVRFVGLCIPWKDAHVRTGRRDREPWQDHLSYLQGLTRWTASLDDAIPTILLGDFNQRFPRSQQPERIYEPLMDLLHPRFRIVTSGVIAGVNAQSIDHLAVSQELELGKVEGFSNFAPDGEKLSDHFGLRVVFRGS